MEDVTAVRAFAYSLAGVGLVGVASVAILYADHPSPSSLGPTLVFALALGLLSTVLSWMLWVGPLAPSATGVRIAPDGVWFEYARGPSLLQRWDSPRLVVVLVDVAAAWDPATPERISERHWIKPPRGPDRQIDPLLRSRIAQRAAELSLRVTLAERRVGRGVLRKTTKIAAAR